MFNRSITERSLTKITRALGTGLVALAATAHSPVSAQDVTVPVLVPLTGFLSLEGNSQRNGAELALRDATAAGIAYNVSDTATSPEVAVNALERAMTADNVVAVVAPMLPVMPFTTSVDPGCQSPLSNAP